MLGLALCSGVAYTFEALFPSKSILRFAPSNNRCRRRARASEAMPTRRAIGAGLRVTGHGRRLSLGRWWPACRDFTISPASKLVHNSGCRDGCESREFTRECTLAHCRDACHRSILRSLSVMPHLPSSSRSLSAVPACLSLRGMCCPAAPVSPSRCFAPSSAAAAAVPRMPGRRGEARVPHADDASHWL